MPIDQHPIASLFFGMLTIWITLYALTFPMGPRMRSAYVKFSRKVLGGCFILAGDLLHLIGKKIT